MRLRSWGWLAGLAAALAFVLAPYLIAWRAQPQGFVFSGFLDNPVDGFSYLAKMRQGAAGSWLFHLPYAADPGPGAFLFVYYLLLGHVQRMIGLAPEIVYHGARLFGALAMLIAAYAFFGQTLPTRQARRWAFALTLFGSGLGWLGIGLGRLPIDLWVPEAIPLVAAFVNPHFPLAAAAMLVALTAVASPSLRRPSRLAWALAAGLLLALVQPFAVVPVTLVAAAWWVWTGARPATDAAPPDVRGDQLAAGLAIAIVSLPVLVYDLAVIRSNPALAAWSRQNLTPTPPWTDVILGFGLVLVLAVAAVVVVRPQTTSGGRLLAVWMVVGLALVFMPFGLQRRMLLGVFFPMAALAALALSELAAQPGRGRRWLAYGLFVLCLPSTIVVMVATLGGALRQAPEIVLSTEERQAYRWVSASLPSAALILAGEVSGNRLPAFADVRVVYGHPFETPNAEETLAWVDSIYRSDRPPAEVLEQLRARSVDFVYVGPRERGLGALGWVDKLERVYQGGDVAIYRVPAP